MMTNDLNKKFRYVYNQAGFTAKLSQPLWYQLNDHLLGCIEKPDYYQDVAAGSTNVAFYIQMRVNETMILIMNLPLDIEQAL